MATKEPTRLGDWQLEQEIDELFYLFDILLKDDWPKVSKAISKIATNDIKRHERTLRRHGVLVETKQTELEKKEEETHA